MMKIQIGDEVRDMTAAEQSNFDAVVAQQAELTKTLLDTAAAAASGRAKFAALSLTDDEINALLGA